MTAKVTGSRAAMEEPKPFASLGPTLLARKGGAKPAMRPQVSPLALDLTAEEDLEDLGWNDMGEEDPAARREAQVLHLTPYSGGHDEDGEEEGDYELPEAAPVTVHAEPEVLRQRQAVAEALEAIHAPAAVRKPKAPAKAAATARGRRAAFTLRLDAERHLKLRLASTVTNMSAQILVTEALDKFLGEMPELEALARQVKRD